jgi:hypothetical protein
VPFHPRSNNVGGGGAIETRNMIATHQPQRLGQFMPEAPRALRTDDIRENHQRYTHLGAGGGQGSPALDSDAVS